MAPGAPLHLCNAVSRSAVSPVAPPYWSALLATSSPWEAHCARSTRFWAACLGSRGMPVQPMMYSSSTASTTASLVPVQARQLQLQCCMLQGHQPMSQSLRSWCSHWHVQQHLCQAHVRGAASMQASGAWTGLLPQVDGCNMQARLSQVLSSILYSGSASRVQSKPSKHIAAGRHLVPWRRPGAASCAARPQLLSPAQQAGMLSAALSGSRASVCKHDRGSSRLSI